MWILNYNLNLLKNKLKKGLYKNAGHNNKGLITVFHKESGIFSKYKLIDFKLKESNIGVILSIDYDLWRSAFISLICYLNSKISYILSINKIKKGDLIFLGHNIYFFWRFCCLFIFLLEFIDNIKKSIEIGLNILKSFKRNLFIFYNGNAFLIKFIPIGYYICNFELYPGKGMQVSRSAGNFARIMSKNLNKVLIKLNSGFFIFISQKCTAIIGKISNLKHNLIIYMKAGNKRKMGVRPHVRGVAMNPVDHPHGGGEGKTSGGRHSVTPWGKITKGKPTVIQKNKRHSNIYNIIK